MSSKLFFSLGCQYMGHGCRLSKIVGFRRFKAFYGVTPSVCSLIWSLIKSDTNTEIKPKHLLWGLNFLKQYSVEHLRRTLFKADEKTIRKYTWIVIELLADMNVVL